MGTGSAMQLVGQCVHVGHFVSENVVQHYMGMETETSGNGTAHYVFVLPESSHLDATPSGCYRDQL